MNSATSSAYQESALAAPAPRGQVRHFSVGDPGFVAFELGLGTLSDARELGDSAASQHSALLLFRSAVIFFLSACSERRADPSAKPWTAVELEQLPEFETAFIGVTLAQVPLVVAALTAESPERALLALSREEREQSLRGLREVALTLGERLALSARGARSLLLARRLKMAALVSCLVLPLAWILLKPLNLALNRPVVVSSRSPQYGVDPSQVVDGKRKNLGFHSDADPGPHMVTVDLGAKRRIHRVDVYNRADCCQERAVPLRLEVSSDGRSFRELITHIDPFALWKAEFPTTDARYVRLVQTSDAVFNLAEIEIY